MRALAVLEARDGPGGRPRTGPGRPAAAGHVLYWTHGGRTDLDNLVLLCHRHHTLVHTEGFQLVLSPDRTLTVRTRDDIPVPHHPTPAWGNPHQLDPTLDIDEHRLPPQWHGEPLDLSYVTMVLLQHAA